MRKVIAGIIAATLLFSLYGCAQEEEQAPAAADKIVIWTWDETFNVKAAKLAAKEENTQRYPDCCGDKGA